MIKAVIFDCFGVLYTDGRSQIIEACPDEKRQALNDLFLQADYGYISGNDFSIAVTELLNMEASVFAAMTDGVYARNELLVERIRSYKKSYKIGLLSNVSENLFVDLFHPEDQAALFDAVVLSSRVGMIKPSEAIYLLAADQLGVSPHEAVMIDDIERNVQGARDAGMQGIQFTSTPQVIADLDALLAEKVHHA